MFAKKAGSDAGSVRANRRRQESGKMVSCRGICTGLCIQQSDDALPGDGRDFISRTGVMCSGGTSGDGFRRF